ncbi:MAG: helix-turn-helix domain-containing protein, partial [Verrucomicrobia bacterium]|nr:helix-turn-helix domain-containing protein [Verrucomicrobiota bacterium]
MSAKERRRAVIMAGVQAGELNLVGAAAVLGLSYRQTKRVWRRYRTAGDAGLVHRLRGRPGPRRKPPELR